MTDAPSVVEVGAVRFSVTFDAGRTADSSTYGFVEHDEAAITLNPTISRDRQRETLLHEVLHVVTHALGVHKDGANELLESDDAEESLVHGMAPWLLSTLRRNPELVMFLLADD